MKQQNGLFGGEKLLMWLALVPIAVLVAMLALVIKVFGADAIGGGSQVALMVASAVAALISVTIYVQSTALLPKRLLPDLSLSVIRSISMSLRATVNSYSVMRRATVVSFLPS